jgi:hypothetical protein
MEKVGLRMLILEEQGTSEYYHSDLRRKFQ